VIGAGAMGLPAAIVAREAGASVIVVEAQNHMAATRSPAAATCLWAAAPARRRSTGSRTRRIYCSAT